MIIRAGVALLRRQWGKVNARISRKGAITATFKTQTKGRDSSIPAGQG